jgi:hypothetical protein
MHIQNKRHLRIIYGILSLTNSTRSTADTILPCTYYPVSNWWFSYPFHGKKYNPLVFPCPICLLTPTITNLCLANSLVTLMTCPLQASHIPNLIFLVHCLGCTKASVQAQGKCESFVTWQIFRWWFVSCSPHPQAGGPLLVGFPRLLFKYILIYPLYWRPVLHPQPEDAPCCGVGFTCHGRERNIRQNL